MFGFLKWIFNPKAPVRPGCFSVVGMLLASPLILSLLSPPYFFLEAVMVVPILLLLLPSMASFRLSNALEKKNQDQQEIQRELNTVFEPPAEQADEYSDLRGDLRRSDQRQALNQLAQLIDKLHDFNAVLDIKFNDTEVTYHRYHDTSQKVFDGAIRNLESIAAFGGSVRSIDGGQLTEQLDVLVSNDQGDSKSAVALRERLEMMAEGRRHIEALLGLNEEALTAMARVTTKLAGVTTQGQAPEDMELMIEDLRDMAERTKRYNTRLEREKPSVTIKR